MPKPDLFSTDFETVTVDSKGNEKKFSFSQNEFYQGYLKGAVMLCKEVICIMFSPILLVIICSATVFTLELFIVGEKQSTFVSAQIHANLVTAEIETENDTYHIEVQIYK